MKIYTENSAFSLADLVKRREDGRWIIGNTGTEIYVSIPQQGYEILRLFESGRTVSEIRKISKDHFGNVNIDAFIRNLIKHDFVIAIDGIPLRQSFRRIKPMFSWIKPKNISFFFSEAAYAGYAVILFSALSILLFFPGYFPRQSDYFFIGQISLVTIISFVTGWLLVFLHELAHHIACRSLGVPATFGITNRLYYVVAVTDVTNIYSKDRKERYRVYLSGIIADALIISLCVIALFLSDMHAFSMPHLIYSFLKFIALIEFFGISWQFYFFLRTDIYYVIENIFRINNLHKKTQLFLRAALRHFQRKTLNNFRPVHSSRLERNVVVAYSVFFVLGIAASIAVLLFYGIPITARLVVKAVSDLFRGAMFRNPNLFYDASIFIIFWFVNQALLLFAMIKSYRLYLRPVFYWASIAAILATNYLLVMLFAIIILVNISNLALIYISMALLGFGFGCALIFIAEKLNKLTNEIIIPLLAPVLSLVFSSVIFFFSSFFIKATRINVPLTSETLPLFAFMYAVGIAVAYMFLTMREKPIVHTL
jgi:putative peptide zinc metalloprotease protein